MLYYPKWIPGEHGPTGPITDLGGLKITAAGKPLTPASPTGARKPRGWRRLGPSGLLGIVVLSPVNLRQTSQLGDVIGICIIVLPHRVPNIDRQQRGDQLASLGVTMPK